MPIKIADNLPAAKVLESENIFVMTRQDIVDLIDFANNGGVLYMRAITAEDADLIIEKQPIQGPMADAIRLEFNKPVRYFILTLLVFIT